MIKMNSIPVNIKSKLTKAITSVFDESNIVLGGLYCNTNHEAEETLQKYTKTPCVLTSNGTSALIISFEYALTLAGNLPVELYVSEYLYFSIASFVEMSGLKVNILKSDFDEVTLMPVVICKDTYNIFIVTSHNNINVNIKEITKNLPSHKNFIIEDRCVVIGNEITDDVDISCYSFSNNKMIIAGEGGAVSSKHKDFLEWARLRTFSGIIPFNSNPNFMYLGNYTNSKIKTPFKCAANAFVGAMIIPQIKNMEDHLSRRRDNYNFMFERLNFCKSQIPVPRAPLFYPLVLPEYINDRQIMKIQMSSLKEGVSTYLGVLPYGHFISNEKRKKRVISLPVHTGLTKIDIENIIRVINNNVEEFVV